MMSWIALPNCSNSKWTTEDAIDDKIEDYDVNHFAEAVQQQIEEIMGTLW
jgi:hypothetical protein